MRTARHSIEGLKSNNIHSGAVEDKNFKDTDTSEIRAQSLYCGARPIANGGSHSYIYPYKMTFFT